MIDHLIVLFLFVQLLAERAQAGYRGDSNGRALAVFAVIDGQLDRAFFFSLREAVEDRGCYDLLPGRAGDRGAEDVIRLIAADVGQGARRRDCDVIAFVHAQSLAEDADRLFVFEIAQGPDAGAAHMRIFRQTIGFDQGRPRGGAADLTQARGGGHTHAVKTVAQQNLAQRIDSFGALEDAQLSCGARAIHRLVGARQLEDQLLLRFLEAHDFEDTMAFIEEDHSRPRFAGEVEILLGFFDDDPVARAPLRLGAFAGFDRYDLDLGEEAEYASPVFSPLNLFDREHQQVLFSPPIVSDFQFRVAGPVEPLVEEPVKVLSRSLFDGDFEIVSLGVPEFVLVQVVR